MSISILDEIIFSLFSLIDMGILGDSLLFFIEKATGDSLRRRLSILEAGLLSVVLGCVYISLFLLVISPFHALSRGLVLIFTVANFSLFLYRHLHKIGIETKVTSITKYVPMVLVFIFVLVVRYQAVLGLYMSSGMDIFALSCYTESIMRAGGLNLFGTIQYGDVWFTYPSGYLGTVAFISVILDMSPEKTMTLLTPLFVSLIYVSLFALPWKAFHNYWMGMFSAVLFLLTYFPMMFVWGGDCLSVSTFIFLVFIMFLFSEGMSSMTNTVILGFTLGYALSVYPMLLLSVLGCILPLLLWTLAIRRHSALDRSFYMRRLGVIFLCALAVSAFTDIQIISAYLNTFNLLNVSNGNMSDIANEPLIPTIWQEMLSKEVFLNLPQAIPRLVDGLAKWFTYSVDRWSTFRSILLASLLYSAVLLFLRVIRNRRFKFGIRSFYAPVHMFLWFLFLFGLVEINPLGIFGFIYAGGYNVILSEFSQLTDRIIFMSTIPVVFFVGYILAIPLNQLRLRCNLRRQDGKTLITLRKQYLPSLVIGVVLLIYTVSSIVPSVYVGSYDYIATVRELSIINTDDYNLMLWMRDNLPRDVSVLVNPNEGGQLIPVIANIRIAFPKGINQGSKTYRYVVDRLINDPDDPSIRFAMEVLNVTYIYCGSGIWYSGLQHFDVSKISQSSSYELIKNIGNAWLFKVVFPQ
jgi:hypothetical protein